MADNVDHPNDDHSREAILASEMELSRLEEQDRAFHDFGRQAYRAESIVTSTRQERSLSENELNSLVASIFITAPLTPAADDNHGIEAIAEAAAEGLSSTGSILSDVASNADKVGFWDIVGEAEELFGKLSKVYNAGKAVYDFIQYINNFGKPSEFDKIMAKLDEISQTLKSIETKIEDGFSNLIAHTDFVAFRSEVDIPAQSLFDLYLRCFDVRGAIPVEDLKKICEDVRAKPRYILSALSTYLKNKGNIFSTQLKAEKYAFSTFKSWKNIVFYQAIRLMTVNLFYYGHLAAESPEDKKKQMEDFCYDETKSHVQQLLEMEKILKQIELDRLKSFHSSGDGKEWISKEFAKIKKAGSINCNSSLPPEFLSGLAHEFKESWKKVNGPHDFYVAIFRGKMGDDNTKDYRQTGYYIGDSEKATVVPNIAYHYDGDFISKDGICLALIQPVTDEMRKATELSNEEMDKIRNIIEKSHDDTNIIASTKDAIAELKKPLLILYSGNIMLGKTYYPIEVVPTPVLYPSIGEAWSAPGGPFPIKFDWHISCAYVRMFYTKCRMLQVIFH